MHVRTETVVEAVYDMNDWIRDVVRIGNNSDNLLS